MTNQQVLPEDIIHHNDIWEEIYQTDTHGSVSLHMNPEMRQFVGSFHDDKIRKLTFGRSSSARAEAFIQHELEVADGEDRNYEIAALHDINKHFRHMGGLMRLKTSKRLIQLDIDKIIDTAGAILESKSFNQPELGEPWGYFLFQMSGGRLIEYRWDNTSGDFDVTRGILKPIMERV